MEVYVITLSALKIIQLFDIKHWLEKKSNIDLTEEITMFSGYMRTPSYSQWDGIGHAPNISFKKLDFSGRNVDA